MEMTNSNSEILMVLPKKTIRKHAALGQGWEIDQDSCGLSVLVDQQPAAYAMWISADDFGTQRPSIRFDAFVQSNKLQLFEVLITRLAIAYDQIPGKYPLYIRLRADDLDLIAMASRMGFVPYFGSWSLKTSEESEETWKRITDSLRNAYPAGLVR